MSIANIVSKDKMDLGPEFNIVENLEDVLCPELPTLIVGCDYTKSKFDIKLNFMNRKLQNNIFWTFNKKELRKNYHNDLEDFIQYSYEYSISKIHYIYLDLIQYNKAKIIKIIKKLISFDNFYSFYYKDMIYIYYDNIIIGVDLELVNFMGYNINKIILKIKSKSKVFLEGSTVLIEYKNYMERLGNKVKYIPFIYSINNYD